MSYRLVVVLVIVTLASAVRSAEVLIPSRGGIWKSFTCPDRQKGFEDKHYEPGIVTADIRVLANASVSLLQIDDSCGGDPFRSPMSYDSRASIFKTKTVSRTIDTTSPTCYLIRNEGLYPVAVNFTFNIRCNVSSDLGWIIAGGIIGGLAVLFGLACLVDWISRGCPRRSRRGDREMLSEDSDLPGPTVSVEIPGSGTVAYVYNVSLHNKDCILAQFDPDGDPDILRILSADRDRRRFCVTPISETSEPFVVEVTEIDRVWYEAKSKWARGYDPETALDEMFDGFPPANLSSDIPTRPLNGPRR